MLKGSIFARLNLTPTISCEVYRRQSASIPLVCASVEITIKASINLLVSGLLDGALCH
jgi:hypothetical protein